eukprot:EG_transcript_12007
MPTLGDLTWFLWLTPAERDAVRRRVEAGDHNALDEAATAGWGAAMEFRSPGFVDAMLHISDGKTKKDLFPWLNQPDPTPIPEHGFTEADDEYDEDGDEYGDCDLKCGQGPPQLGVRSVTGGDVQRLEALIERTLAGEREFVFREMRADEELAAECTRAEWEASQKADKSKIEELLLKAGLAAADIQQMSLCVRAGLLRGAFGFTFTGASEELDRVAVTTSCEECQGPMEVTVRALLRQRDYAGLDYADEGRQAVLKCAACGRGRYVSACCRGTVALDCGKSHNHCRDCPGLGTCIYDYRNAHCHKCGRHFFQGRTGFACPCSLLRRAIKRARLGDRAAIAALHYAKDFFHREDDPSKRRLSQPTLDKYFKKTKAQ